MLVPPPIFRANSCNSSHAQSRCHDLNWWRVDVPQWVLARPPTRPGSSCSTSVFRISAFRLHCSCDNPAFCCWPCNEGAPSASGATPGARSHLSELHSTAQINTAQIALVCLQPAASVRGAVFAAQESKRRRQGRVAAVAALHGSNTAVLKPAKGSVSDLIGTAGSTLGWQRTSDDNSMTITHNS